jgi:hypothetical protein
MGPSTRTDRTNRSIGTPIKKIAVMVFVIGFVTNSLFSNSYNVNESQSFIVVEEPKREADGCYHVFLDVGANIGVQSRFLLEPEKYPKAKKADKLFSSQFGTIRDNRDFCTFEFEQAESGSSSGIGEKFQCIRSNGMALSCQERWSQRQ